MQTSPTTRATSGRSRRPASPSTAGAPGSSAAGWSRSATTMRPTRSPGRMSSSRSGPDPGSRRSRASRTSTCGRIARRPSRASCRPACSCWGAGRPVANWPRSTPASRSPRPSSNPARAWPRPTIPAIPRRSGRPCSPTASRSDSACGRFACTPRPDRPVSTWSSSTTVPRRRVTSSSSRSAGSSRSAISGSSTTASMPPPDCPSRATAGCGSTTGCTRSATRRARNSTPTRPTTRASSPCGWRWGKRYSRTTAPCRARPTRIRRPPRSASPWARRSITATMRSSWSRTSRGPQRATRSRPASGT